MSQSSLQPRLALVLALVPLCCTWPSFAAAAWSMSYDATST